MWPNPQETASLVTFTEEILNGKLHFSCSVLLKLSSGSNIRPRWAWVDLCWIGELSKFVHWPLTQWDSCNALLSKYCQFLKGCLRTTWSFLLLKNDVIKIQLFHYFWAFMKVLKYCIKPCIKVDTWIHLKLSVKFARIHLKISKNTSQNPRIHLKLSVKLCKKNAVGFNNKLT